LAEEHNSPQKIDFRSGVSAAEKTLFFEQRAEPQTSHQGKFVLFWQKQDVRGEASTNAKK